MLARLIEQRLQEAVAAALPDAAAAGVLIRPCPNPEFGDYQTSGLIALAKAHGLNPRQLAQNVLARLDVLAWCDHVDVAGAGFVNFRLRPAAIAEVVRSTIGSLHAFFDRASAPRTIVIDFSSPNVAKPMHVGHIRSTVLGDCLARVLRLLGHRVVTDNHLGDWGTQFGKLIVGWRRFLDPAALAQEPIAEMERLYKTVNTACETDPGVLESARQELVKLQTGDPENLALWREMIALSQRQFDAIYTRLGVAFDHTFGESFYSSRLGSVVREFVERKIARESEGAMVVFFDDQPELKAHPLIIQKSDGAANYATTDLATLAYRWETWQPQEIVYVTDGRQQLHFKQVFAAFRRWHPEARPKLAHVWFGSILGPDGRPFKTRAGETVKLADLLDEAEERALKVVSDKNPELSEPDRREIARVVGIGAVKYADLLPNRQSDYIFDWDKMLALQGNTAPYLLYAHTRIRSIFRKLPETVDAAQGWAEAASREFVLRTPEEVRLAKHLLVFGLVLEAVGEEYRPNYLCNFLYELAGHFTSFYENCPVLRAPEPERSSRLALADLTGQVLRQGLAVLGLEATDRM